MRKIALAIRAAVAASLLAGAAAAQTVRLDFGAARSPVRKGFVRVTDKTAFPKGAVAGWVAPSGLKSENHALSREWKFNKWRGISSPPPIYTTDLRQDFVGAAGPARLRVAAKDGPWRVWMLVGTGFGARGQVWDVTVRSGGAAREATWVGRYTPRIVTLDASAKGGALDIDLSTKSRWTLCALVAAPAGLWPSVQASTVAKLQQEIHLLPDDVLKKWKRTPHVDKTPPPKLTPEEKRRGFVLYHRPWIQPVWPNTVPRREDMNPTLRAFASPDEYEPLTFTVLPRKQLGAATVEVGDLVSSAGRVIPSSAVDVRYVRHMYVRPNYRTYYTYYRAPDILMPFRSPQPLVNGENFRVWLTVRVPTFAADGVYKGAATLKLDGRPAARAPIVFRVLPIQLQKDESIVYGTYYRHPYDSARRAPDDFSRRWWQRKAELEFADMAAHGNNAIVSGIGARMDAAGRWSIDFDTLGRKIDLCRRYGFDKPMICHIPASHIYWRHMKTGMGSHIKFVKMPPKAYFDDLTRLVRLVEAGRRRRQWPELLYYPIDEPSRSEIAVRFMAETMKAIKRVPGARTYVTADPAHDEFAPMKPYVDVWCCQPYSLPREQIVADTKKRGVEYWCYPNHVAGENDHTAVIGARMTYGFGFWRSGFRALTPWIYQSVGSDPWNYLDGTSMDFFNRTDDDGSPIPCAMWEAYREGIDDGRYVTTLQRWIARARARGLTKAADDAEADLRFVWNAIEPWPKYKYDAPWEPDSFNVYRWVVARRIIQLKQLVSR